MPTEEYELFKDKFNEIVVNLDKLGANFKEKNKPIYYSCIGEARLRYVSDVSNKCDIKSNPGSVTLKHSIGSNEDNLFRSLTELNKFYSKVNCKPIENCICKSKTPFDTILVLEEWRLYPGQTGSFNYKINNVYTIKN